MTKTSAMYEKKKQRTDDRTDLRSLSGQQLIEGFLEGNGKENRPAWNEFFRRFIPYIKEGIREQLKSCRRLDLCYNQEVLLDIHEKIVVKLYSRGVLRQCTNPSGIRSWLKEARKLCRPSNRNIAELVGIPEEKANQISNILIRAREALQRFNVQNPTKQ